MKCCCLLAVYCAHGEGSNICSLTVFFLKYLIYAVCHFMYPHLPFFPPFIPLTEALHLNKFFNIYFTSEQTWTYYSPPCSGLYMTHRKQFSVSLQLPLFFHAETQVIAHSLNGSLCVCIMSFCGDAILFLLCLDHTIENGCLFVTL